MFSNNQNPWDLSNLFWQSLQNNEKEDRYRRDPRTGELGYYPMPPSTPTSHHLTAPPMPGFYGYYSQPPFFPKTQNIPQTQNTTQTESVPESQAEPTSSKKRSHRKKDESEKRATKKIEFWSPKEEFELVKA
ncbi:hypothetical protein Hanom_Chr09g00801671 [Helianthus anomalus]